jgi:hypothetical protein
MINLLLNILASALFSYYFIEMGRFPLKWKLNFKPFNCLVCLPAWVALALYMLPIEATEIIIVMFASAILAVLFKTLMNKAYESGSH